MSRGKEFVFASLAVGIKELHCYTWFFICYWGSEFKFSHLTSFGLTCDFHLYHSTQGSVFATGYLCMYVCMYACMYVCMSSGLGEQNNYDPRDIPSARA